MDKYKEMQVFTRIAERNSFTLAAEDLLIPRSTLTNTIKRLENRLGVRLLERTTRQVRLTLEGEGYYKQCLRLLSDLEEVESSFLKTTPKGVLRVNLQGTLAKHYVMPFLSEFLQSFPDIKVHIAEDDRMVNLVKEGVDCVLRAGELIDSSLIVKPLVSLEQVTVVSPRYFDKYGPINDLETLKQHVSVAYSLDVKSRPSELEFMVNNKLVRVNLMSSVAVSGAEIYTASAKAGLGIIQVPKYRIADELAKGELIEVLSDYPPPSLPVAILYPQKEHLATRTRVFVDWLESVFKKRLS